MNFLRTWQPLALWAGLVACSTGFLRSADAVPPDTEPVAGLRDKTPSEFALTEARIVVAPGRVIERGTVVVRDGLIAAVGAEAAIPPGARIVNLQGKTVYAGLIDAYGELSLPDESSRGGAPSWSPDVVPQRRTAEHFKPDTGVNEKFRGQGVGARLLAPSNGILKGTSALVATGDDPAARSLLVPDVAQHVRLTIGFGGRRTGFPNSPMGAVALARQTMLDAHWYRDAWAAHRSQPNIPAPDRNDALEALQTLAGSSQSVVIDASDEQFALRADRFAREFNLRLIIRGSGHEYRRLEAIRALDRPLVIPVDFPKAPFVATPEAAENVSIEDLLHWDIAPENPARLDQAGVRFAFTSHGLKDPQEFLAAIRKAVRRGLNPDSALRALTVTPAELLGAKELLGTVEPGRLANLVVTDGDLFDAKTRVQETWVLGQRYRIERTPTVDAAGTWKLTLDRSHSAAPQPPTGATLDLKATRQGLEGKLVLQLPAKKPEEKKTDEKSADEKKGDKEKEAAKKPEEKKSSGKKDEANKPKKKPNAANPKDDKEDKSEKSDKSPDSQTAAKELALKHLVLADARLSGAFDASELGRTGLAQFSVVVQSDDKGATLLGEIVWPDGSRSVLRAIRLAAEKLASEQATKADKNPDAESKLGAESKPVPDGEPKPASDAAKSASFPVVFPLGAFGRAAPPELPRHVLFTHATIWTCGPAGILEDASLLIENGKIAAVGRDLPTPPGAVVMDCRGRHLSPGIIDCHSHMGTDGGINESSQSITAEVRIGDFIDATDVNIYRQLAGGVTAAHVLHGSANTIGGQCQLIKLRWGALPEELKFQDAPATIKFALGENVKQSNWGDRSTGRYPQSRMGVEQILVDAFQAAKEYSETWERWRREPVGRPPRRDLELDALAEILHKKRFIHCHSYRQDEILVLLRTMEAYGVRIQTLQHILEGYKLASEIAKHGATSSAFSDWWAYKFEVLDAIPYNGALMHQAGVVVSFNSDDRELARHLNHEAAKAVKYGGVPPAEALKFVTLNPARQLLVDSLVGSLEPGKQADLVVWSSSPLSTMSRCEQTWIDGRKYFDREEDRKTLARAAQVRATLVQKILATGEEMRGPGESYTLERELWTRDDEFCRAKQGATK